MQSTPDIADLPPLLIILDLDETLLHADGTNRATPNPCDFTFETYRVWLRPGLEPFLKSLSNWADLAIWSSSTDDYLAAMLTHFPWQPDWRFLMYRDHCTLRRNPELDSWTFTKNLDKLPRLGYSLDRILIVDDSPEKIPRHYGNLVPMPPFFGDPADPYLPLLASYLPSLAHLPTIRRIEKRQWFR